MDRNSSTPRDGSITLATVFFIAIVAILASAVFLVTTNSTRFTKRSVDRSAAMSYAEGALENLFHQWRNALVGKKDGLSTNELKTLLVKPDTTLPTPTGLKLNSATIEAADPLLVKMPNPDDRPKPEAGSKSSLRQRLHYLARVSVTFNGPGGTDEVILERCFVRAGRNLFDDFLFSTQRVTEIHPGKPMYIDRSYIDADLYTAHNDLHLMDNLVVNGKHENNYHPEDSRRGTAPTILNGGLSDNWNPNNPPRPGQQQKLLDTPRNKLEEVFLDHPTNNDVSADGNPDNDGYHELLEPQLSNNNTDPLQLDATVSERLHKNADYRIQVDTKKDSKGNWVNSVTIYQAGSSTPLPTSNAAYIALNGALNITTAINDVREGGYIRLTNLDVGAVTTAVKDSKVKDVINNDGLLLYVEDISTGKAVPAKWGTTNVTTTGGRGIRLLNGAKLPSFSNGTGFTVASPNPVYIQGDYNTGTTSTTKPASNTTTKYTPPNDKPSPSVPGYDRVPSAVVGDAVNILSNSWADGVGYATASNTTVNTALIAGNVPTVKNGTAAGQYSGGIENFMRFHENWSGKYFTITGALALLYTSTQAKGYWSAAKYDPPDRRWYYEQLFRYANPPGISPARAYERGHWTIRS